MLKPMILAGLGLVGLVVPAAALPLARPEAPAAPLVKVYAGCGPYGHRGPYGGCRPGGQWGGQWGGYVGRACPPGWHLGPYGQRCWRNAGFYRPPVFRTYAYGYRRWGWHRGWGWRGGWHQAGWHRGGWRGGWHRRFAWHGGRRWGGFRHAGWHRGFHGGWHHRR